MKRIVSSECRRRVWRSREEIAALLERYERSGLTQAGFALESGVCLSTLRAWLRRARRERDDQAAPAPARLVQVRVREPAGGGQESPLGELAPLVACPAFELSWGDGARLVIPSGFDARSLSRLLGVLGRPC